MPTGGPPWLGLVKATDDVNAAGLFDDLLRVRKRFLLRLLVSDVSLLDRIECRSSSRVGIESAIGGSVRRALTARVQYARGPAVPSRGGKLTAMLFSLSVRWIPPAEMRIQQLRKLLSFSNNANLLRRAQSWVAAL